MTRLITVILYASLLIVVGCKETHDNGGQPRVDITYMATGTGDSAFVQFNTIGDSYANDSGPLPWSYTWSTIIVNRYLMFNASKHSAEDTIIASIYVSGELQIADTAWGTQGTASVLYDWPKAHWNP